MNKVKYMNTYQCKCGQILRNHCSKQIRKHWFTKKHKRMKAEKEIRDKKIKEDKKLGIKSEFIVIFE